MRVAVRNWLIRGLILAGVAAVAALGWVANSWVSPERVREKVLAHLNEQLDGVDVHVGSARMRILGGIAVEDLRLVRHGDPPDRAFLVVPSAVLYHDKEQLNRGRLVIKKVELENPELRLEKAADGKWNVETVLKAGPADRPVPTFVAKGATVTVLDSSPGGLPQLRLAECRFTVLNDPLPVLTLQLQANAQGFGPVTVRARVNRVTRHLAAGLELPEFPLGEFAPAAAERIAPDLAPHLKKLAATAAVRADLTFTPDAAPAWRHDVRVELKDGRFEHPDLPWPAEKIAVKVRVVDGRVKLEEASAQVGPAHLKVALETRNDLASGGRKPPEASDTDPLTRIEDQLQTLRVDVTGVPLDDALFARLGPTGATIKRMFAPTGSADLGYRFAREAGGWKREFEVRPKSVGMTYEKFKYPVSEVRGWVKKTVTHAGNPHTQIDLVGTAGGQPVTMKGQISGDGEDPAIGLRIAGGNVPIDDKMLAALPGHYPDLIRQFRATGRVDFVAEINQQLGVNLCENEFRVDVRDGTVNYTGFPYPVEQVKGRVVVRVNATDPTRPVQPVKPGETPRAVPERDEVIYDAFTGVHAGATVWMHGSKRPIPGTKDRKLLLHMGGNNCPIDADLKTALGALKIESVWNTFAPRGGVTFAADVEILDRGPHPSKPDHDPPFNPATDLRMTFNFYGPTVTPSFFPYELTDLSGWLEYKNGRVDLAHFAGRHGDVRLRMAAGEVRFYPDGAVWANLGGLEVKPFTTDAAMLKALPGKLRSGFEELKLKGPAELTVKHLVVLTPPDPTPGGAIPPPEPFPVGPVSGGKAATPAGSPLPHLVARAQAPASPPRPLPPPTKLPEEPDPVVYWDAEIRLAGASLEVGVPWEEVFGRVGCRGRYEGTHVGLVRGSVLLDRAVIAKQPVTAVFAHAKAAPQQPDPARPGQFLPTEVEFTDVDGKLFHGTVGGEARVVLTDPTRYELWITAADVQLEEVARHYKLGSEADLKGKAQAQLRLYNRPDPRTGALVTQGDGKIDVPAGRMYNLPVMLDLVKVLKLQTPDKTAFEEAHATFRVQGDRVKVEQLDLIGKALCVGGSGEIDTSGEYVRFEFYTLGSQILAKMVNTPIGDLGAFLSKNLFKIRMTRENGELKYRPEPVPAVTEPVRAIVERLKGRAGKPPGK